MYAIQMEASKSLKLLSDIVDDLPKAMRVVTRDTAKKGKRFMADLIREELVIKLKDVNKDLFLHFPDATTAVFGLRRSGRFSIKRFSHRQTRKGVSYRASKTIGRKLIPHAFINPTLGSHVFVRASTVGKTTRMKTKNKEAIFKTHAPSPWGVMKSNNRQPRLLRMLQTELNAQINESLRVNTLRAGKNLRNQ